MYQVQKTTTKQHPFRKEIATTPIYDDINNYRTNQPGGVVTQLGSHVVTAHVL